jgi:subtilisin family serine protease
MSHCPPARQAPKSVLAMACAACLLAACGGGSDDTPAEAGIATPSSTPMRALMLANDAVQRDVVVMLRSGVSANSLASAYGVTLIDQFGKRPIYRLRAASASAVPGLIQRMRADVRVQFAERNETSETPEARWDVSWAVWDVSWAIGNGGQTYAAQWAPQAMGLAAAHQLSLGAGVRVAVLDTGADLQHPALSGQLLRGPDGRVVGRDFVDDDDDPSEIGGPADKGWGHGTHVAGLTALAAPQAKLMPLRVLDPAGRGNLWVLAEALLHAVDPDGNPDTDDGAHIINLSLGTSAATRLMNTAVELATCSDDDDNEAEDDYADPGFDDDRSRCNQRAGAVVLAAAGNSGSSSERVYPAAEGAEGQLAVTAVDAQGQLPAFANRGDWVQIAAPGDRLISPMPGGGYAVWSGTSMAAPLASGVAALVLARNPDWKAVDVTKRLLDRSNRICGTTLARLNAAAAVLDYTPPSSC